jgi:hypothetical protein
LAELNIPIGGIVRSRGTKMVYQMISSNAPHGSTLRIKKPRMLRADLAERFLELQRLRKKVSELEKLLASDPRRARGDLTNLVGRPK